MASGPSAAPAPAMDSVESATDHQLEEKISRLVDHLSTGLASALPDKGVKLQIQLRHLQEELDRRRRRQNLSSVDIWSSDRFIQSKCAESSGSVGQSDSPSSFAKLFNKKLDEKADAAPGREGTRISNQEKCKNITKDEQKLQEIPGSQLGTVSCRERPFKSVMSIADKERKDSPNLGNDISVVSTKRKRVYEIEDSSRSKSKKRQGQEVVLLDEEIQPLQTTKEETSNQQERKIYYPSRDHPESVELDYADTKCLDPGEYLSSTIMNFYIMYLQKLVSLTSGSHRNYHFFNTYFYNKLEEAMSPKGERKASFLKLRRWWRGVNIFQKAYIFLPIYGEMHWSLAIVCIPREENSGPIVLHLDSLGYHNSTLIFNVIDKYLKEEWNYMNLNNTPIPKLPIPEKIWRNLPRRIEKKVVPVPQQENDYDCGLFVLCFMEQFIEKAPEWMRRKDISTIGSKWFQSVDALALRNRIKELVLEVFESANKLEIENSDSQSSRGEELGDDET